MTKRRVVNRTRTNRGGNKKKQKVSTVWDRVGRRTRSAREESVSSDSDTDIEVNESNQRDDILSESDHNETPDDYLLEKVRTKDIEERAKTMNVGTIVTIEGATNTGNKDDVSKMGTTVSTVKSVEEQYDGFKVANSQALKRFIKKRFIKDFKFCNQEIAEVVVEECYKCNELRVPDGMGFNAFVERTAKDLVPRIFNDCRHTIQSALRLKYLSKYKPLMRTYDGLRHEFLNNAIGYCLYCRGQKVRRKNTQIVSGCTKNRPKLRRQ